MIKVIKTEGKTGQEVQDYLDRLVDYGANSVDCVKRAKCKHYYKDCFSHTSFSYAGVDIDGDTLLSDDLEEFGSFDIERLLNIEECAKKICNAVFETGDHDEIEKQAIEIRSLLS